VVDGIAAGLVFPDVGGEVVEVGAAPILAGLLDRHDSLPAR
jgi:hypothetical protein